MRLGRFVSFNFCCRRSALSFLGSFPEDRRRRGDDPFPTFSTVPLRVPYSSAIAEENDVALVDRPRVGLSSEMLGCIYLSIEYHKTTARCVVRERVRSLWEWRTHSVPAKKISSWSSVL
jgi:hypothetical protein